jgi:hypothetical protein
MYLPLQQKNVKANDVCKIAKKAYILLSYVINTKFSAYSYTEIADDYYMLCYFVFTLGMLFNRMDNFMAFNRQYMFIQFETWV